MLIATRSTVYALESDTPEIIFDNQPVIRVVEGDRFQIIALKTGDLVILSEGNTQTFTTGIEEDIEALHILGEDPLHLLIGTEAPHVYRLLDGKVKRLESFDQLECRDDFYTPWGGPAAVRSFASTPDGWVYADIHVGSIMRSPDRGDTWEPVTPDLNDDVHQVATSPQTNDRVYANTARSVYISDDRGQSWDHRSEGFPYQYGRAIAVHPADKDCLLATVSKGPHGDAGGQLYHSTNAGQSWNHVTGGYPETIPGNIDTFQVAFSQDGTAWSIVEQTLYRSDDRGQTWTAFWNAPEEINMIDCR